MNFLPEILQGLTILCIAGAVFAFTLGAVQLYAALHQRYLAQVGSTDAALLAGNAQAAGLRVFEALRGSIIRFLAAVNERHVSESRLKKIGEQLRRAGRPQELTAAELLGFSELLAVFFSFFGAMLGFSLNVPLYYTVPLAVALGALYPFIWLRDRIKARLHQITRALPYNLDLLTLSVEAGLDFAAALGKVVEKGRKGPLGEELATTLKELRLGKTREEALRNLAARIDLPSLTTFVNALVQADKMGTPLGKVLRILSTQMRIERTQRAEKLANEAPVKLLFPLVAFIFPTIFLMLFGPIAYQLFSGKN